MSFRLSSRALTDLRSIVDYISDFNPNAAHRLVNRLEDRWELLTTQPRSGVLRTDLGTGLRQVVVGEYISIYRVEVNDVEIIRVLHGRRDITPDDMSG